MAIAKQVLELTFLNASGKEVKLVVQSPKENLSATEINKAMDGILSLGAVSGNYNAMLTEKKSAHYIQTHLESIML